MNKMKKILAIIITAALLTASLTACSNSDSNGGGSEDTSTTTSAAEESTEAPAETSAPETEENTENTEDTEAPSESGETAKILDAVKSAYGDDYLPNMPIEKDYLTSVLGLEEGSFTDFAGELPMISAHADIAVIIKAAEGKAGDVKAKLEAYQTYLIEDSLQYPMNLAKVNASKVLENGDFVGFIILGKIDEREEATEDEQAAFAEEQIKIGVDAFNAYFG